LIYCNLHPLVFALLVGRCIGVVWSNCLYSKHCGTFLQASLLPTSTPCSATHYSKFV